jgi:hypothetical protein
VGEVFGDSLLYVDSSQVKEVAKKVRMLATDKELMELYRRRITEKYEFLRGLTEGVRTAARIDSATFRPSLKIQRRP